MNPAARVLSLAEETKRRAHKHGYDRQSHAFRSYANGQWQVAANEHPEIGSLKSEFLKLMGVLV